MICVAKFRFIKKKKEKRSTRTRMCEILQNMHQSVKKK